MDRKIINNLKTWKESKERKPLILRGARQVGKTYILHQFGSQCFEKYHYVNFENNPKLSQIFKEDTNVARIFNDLSFYLQTSITPQKDLLLLDEIQECPEALVSLKYFCELMPELHLCCAGSLLGVKLSKQSFPVGKVDFLEMHPLDFEEFLVGVEDHRAIEALDKICLEKKSSITVHDYLWQRLLDYFVVGGLPEVVQKYKDHKGSDFEKFEDVRKVQKTLVHGYSNDFAKYAGGINAMHIKSVFDNIPLQLAKNEYEAVKKYIFKDVIPQKKRFADLEGPINWLVEAGLAIKVMDCDKAQVPLKAYCKPNRFKLFMFDVGILGSMLELKPKDILADDYGTIKGYFAENYVAQEMIGNKTDQLYSWSVGRSAEIEFIHDSNDGVIPIEVKSGKNTKSTSLKKFVSDYHPHHFVIFSKHPIDIRANERRLPLYLCCRYCRGASPNEA